jgi:hypothetical protein
MAASHGGISLSLTSLGERISNPVARPSRDRQYDTGPGDHHVGNRPVVVASDRAVTLCELSEMRVNDDKLV